MIKKGIKVKILTGKDKNKDGDVIEIDRKNNRAKVKGINMVKKHVRPNPNKQEQGGIKEIEAPIQISNVAIYNPMSKKADRVGFKKLEDGGKVRIFKSNNEQIDS